MTEDICSIMSKLLDNLRQPEHLKFYVKLSFNDIHLSKSSDIIPAE